MIRRRLLLLACLALLATACGPAIRSTRFALPAPMPRTGDVLIFSTRLPECPYEEVGLVSGKRRGFWTSMEEVLEAMRRRAREMGGDAIVGLGSSEVVTGASQAGGAVNLDTTDRLAGTVVRFADPGCRR